MKSGVPQGSVLGPLLFFILINDIQDGIMFKIRKFADDSKICSSVVDETDAELVQKYLKNLFNWSEDWQMLFNIDKCIVNNNNNNNELL